jgi:K+-transporting ATPase ATPase C chain
MGIMKQLKPAALLLVCLSVVTGLVYPLVMTGIAQLFFSHRANGSLIEHDGKVVGSELIGQQFDDPEYFWGRLSATAPAYNAGASSGSNYGPLNPALKDAAAARIDALKKADPQASGPVPVDLVTASGSGLDPHISQAAAQYQLTRVARARGLDAAVVAKLVKDATEDRQIGFLGEPVVNVLQLNLMLEKLSPADQRKVASR